MHEEGRLYIMSVFMLVGSARGGRTVAMAGYVGDRISSSIDNRVKCQNTALLLSLLISEGW